METIAERQAIQQGFAAWAPRHAVKLPNRQTILRVMFPRYVLVQFDPLADPWGKLNSTRGVDHVLVSPSGRPLEAPWPAVERLFALAGPNGVIYPPEPREVRSKDTVRVVDGPFSSFTGLVTRTTRQRVWALLEIFGRRSEIELKRGAVELMG